MMETLKDRPVFICGHPKAGTSLLRNLLDGHPQLVVYPEESRFFRNFLPKVKSGILSPLDAAKQELLQMFAWNLEDPPEHQAGFLDRDYSDFSFEQMAEQLEEAETHGKIRHEGDWLAEAVLIYGKAAGVDLKQVQWWVEKTPYNEQYAEQIFRYWPQARCIQIVRDPCDNYASYQRKQKGWSPGFFSVHWVRSTAKGFSNHDRYGKDRYMILRFEDLVRSQEETLTKITRFLDISDDAALRIPTRAGKSWVGNSMFQEQFQEISAAPVGRWKQFLSERDAALIQLITGKYRTQLGYMDISPRQMGDYFSAAYWQARRFGYDLLKGKSR